MLLSEITGKTNDEVFKVKGWTGEFKINFMDTLFRRPNEKCDWIAADSNVVLSVIRLSPDGIIHLPPPLTDEQREQLKAIWTLGGRWLAKDANLCMYAYSVEPEKNRNWNEWVPINYNGHVVRFTIYRDLDACSLVSWSDPEPYDISKALGVE